MATNTANSGCGPSQQGVPLRARHMSLPDTCLGVCHCGTCPTFYNLAALSPAMSACSSIQGDMSPDMIWSSKMHTQTPEFFQPPLGPTYFEAPQTLLGMPLSPDRQTGLDQADPAFYSLRISDVDESTGPTTTSSSNSDGPFAAFEPISTIASRNEVKSPCALPLHR
jgi:hypothetical protein